jgi:hypothetical protein
VCLEFGFRVIQPERSKKSAKGKRRCKLLFFKQNLKTDRKFDRPEMHTIVCNHWEKHVYKRGFLNGNKEIEQVHTIVCKPLKGIPSGPCWCLNPGRQFS